MATHVSAAEVVYRLRSLTSTEVDSTTLASAAYIAAGDAWLDQVLSESSLDSFSNLSSTKQALCKAAELAWISARVIADAPLRGADAGPIKIFPVTADDKKAMLEILKEEWKEYLSLVGASSQMGSYGFERAGGADYMPESEDDTQIDYVDDDTFSVWSRDIND